MDDEKAWPSVNHSVLSDSDEETTIMVFFNPPGTFSRLPLFPSSWRAVEKTDVKMRGGDNEIQRAHRSTDRDGRKGEGQDGRIV